MTRITEMDLLVGQSEEISLTDLRSRIGDVIAQVQMGKTFRITKSGTRVAEISSPEPTALELGAAVRKMNCA